MRGGVLVITDGSRQAILSAGLLEHWQYLLHLPGTVDSPHPTTVFTRDRGLAFSHGLRFGKCMDFQPRYLIAGADGLANCVMSLPADGEVKQCLGAA